MSTAFVAPVCSTPPAAHLAPLVASAAAGTASPLSSSSFLSSSVSSAAASPLSSSSLRIQLVSDLHVEFYASGEEAFDRIFGPAPNVAAPVLALCGDIGVVQLPQLEEFLDLCSRHWETLWWLGGNHELYVSKEDATSECTTERLSDRCREAALRLSVAARRRRCLSADAPAPVVFFDRNSVEVAGGRVRVIGATLWTSIPEEARHDAERRNDYAMIYTDGSRLPACAWAPPFAGRLRLITTEDVNAWHAADVAFITEELRAAKRLSQVAVVLTHHAPYTHGVSSPTYTNRLRLASFATDLSHLFAGDAEGLPVHTWAYGHTHFCTDFTVKGTRLVSNQRGYPLHVLYDAQGNEPPREGTAAFEAGKFSSECAPSFSTSFIFEVPLPPEGSPLSASEPPLEGARAAVAGAGSTVLSSSPP